MRQRSDAGLRADPAGAARRALAGLQAATGHIIVHFDVDAPAAPGSAAAKISLAERVSFSCWRAPSRRERQDCHEPNRSPGGPRHADMDQPERPLANFPHYGTGVSLAAAREALAVFLTAPDLAAVVLTEVNPSYEPSGRALARYVDNVGGTLASCLAGLG